METACKIARELNACTCAGHSCASGEDSSPCELTASVDWVKAGAVTPIKDQAQCGSNDGSRIVRQERVLRKYEDSVCSSSSDSDQDYTENGGIYEAPVFDGWFVSAMYLRLPFCKEATATNFFSQRACMNLFRPNSRLPNR